MKNRIFLWLLFSSPPWFWRQDISSEMWTHLIMSTNKHTGIHLLQEGHFLADTDNVIKHQRVPGSLMPPGTGQPLQMSRTAPPVDRWWNHRDRYLTSYLCANPGQHMVLFIFSDPVCHLLDWINTIVITFFILFTFRSINPCKSREKCTCRRFSLLPQGCKVESKIQAVSAAPSLCPELCSTSVMSITAQKSHVQFSCGQGSTGGIWEEMVARLRMRQ